MGYRFNENLRMSVAVNNLFDRDCHEREGGVKTYHTPGRPRNVMVTMRMQF